MAAAIVIVDALWIATVSVHSLPFTILRLIVEGIVGTAVFAIVALLLKMQELSEIWIIIRPT